MLLLQYVLMSKSGECWNVLNLRRYQYNFFEKLWNVILRQTMEASLSLVSKPISFSCMLILIFPTPSFNGLALLITPWHHPDPRTFFLFVFLQFVKSILQVEAARQRRARDCGVRSPHGSSRGAVGFSADQASFLGVSAGQMKASCSSPTTPRRRSPSEGSGSRTTRRR